MEVAVEKLSVNMTEEEDGPLVQKIAK